MKLLSTLNQKANQWLRRPPTLIIGTLFFVVLALSFTQKTSAQGSANENALRRICHSFHDSIKATFLSVSVVEPIKDEIPLCWFDDAGFGALGLIQIKFENKEPLAKQAFRNSSGTGEDDCMGGDLYRGAIDGLPVRICRYADGSSIDLKTLLRGPRAPENADLSRALELL